MKKAISILLLCALMVGLCVGMSGCGSKQETTKIGVILYNFTDIQGKEIQAYCDYLKANFPVEFVYRAVGSNDEDHISGLQDLLSQGCKAIISGYDTALSKSIAMCEEAGCYYVVALGSVSAVEFPAPDYQPTPVEGIESKYFLGGTTQFGGDPAAVGVAYAQKAAEAGLKHIGAITFPTFAFAEGQAIYEAFKATLAQLNPDAEVYDLQEFMFTQELCNAEVTALISNHPEVDAVLGLGSGLDFIRPALQAQNRSDIKLLALGYNDTVQSLMESGSVITAGTNNYTQITASCFARIYDALNGNSYADRTAEDLNAVVGYPVILSMDDLADFQQIVVAADKANSSITVDELKSVMVTTNKDATWAALNELTSRDVAAIKAARG